MQRYTSYSAFYQWVVLTMIFCMLCIQQNGIFAWQQSLPSLPLRQETASSLRRGEKSIIITLLNLSSSENNNNNYQDPVLRLPLMEAELATLMEDNPLSVSDVVGGSSEESSTIVKEKLETDISNAKTTAEFGVRKSQSQFYEAFSSGDYEAMSTVWSDMSHVRCVHPGMESIEGRDDVLASWKQIFESALPPTEGGVPTIKFEIEPAKTQINISGLTAICSCIEKTKGGGELEALNIYQRENGCWKMILHHASPIMMRSTSGGGGAVF